MYRDNTRVHIWYTVTLVLDDARTQKARKRSVFRAFKLVAGAGFEPATFGL